MQLKKELRKNHIDLMKKSIDKMMCSINRALNEENEFDRMIFYEWLIKDGTSEKKEMNNMGSFGVGISIYREV